MPQGFIQVGSSSTGDNASGFYSGGGLSPYKISDLKATVVSSCGTSH